MADAKTPPGCPSGAMGAVSFEVGEIVVVAGSTALRLWGLQESAYAESKANAYCAAAVVGRDGQTGWPIITLWGRSFILDPAMIVDRDQVT